MGAKKNDILNGISFYIEYFDYAYANISGNIDITKEKCEYLKCMFLGIFLTLWKDEYLPKNDNVRDIKVIEGFLDAVTQTFFEKDTKFRMGTFEFDHSYELLEKLRNKLAHGDFKVEDGSIILREVGNYFKCPISTIQQLATTLDINFKDAFLYGENSRCIIYTRHAHIFNTLEEFLDESYYVEIIDKPKGSRKRNEVYYDQMKQLKKMVIDFITKHKISLLDSKCVKYIEDKAKAVTSKLNAHFRVKVTKCSDLECFSDIKSYCEDYGELFGNLVFDRQYELLGYVISHFLIENGDKKTISRGILNNIVILDNLIKDPNTTMNELYQDQNYGHILYINQPETVIALVMCGFYLTYQYGLDNVYNTGSESLYHLMNGEAFDYSILDLSEFDDPNMYLDAFTLNYDEQVAKSESDYLDACARLEEIETNYDNYLKYNKKPSVEREKYFKDVIERLSDNKKYYRDARLFFEEFKERKDKYVRNRNIISHIRNAFAHGNVRVTKFAPISRVMDNEILIEDIFEGKVTYSKKMLIGDFIKILSYDKLTLLGSFLTEDKVKEL